ncbi:hypothetical protein F2Q69_00005379 [Brassica cretica]|uniref:Replication protein A 70 kDa DNA-binding subunit B/D first OB fold domain-containing protein n=1 Tax=Brassica cretica TaxID=69181 RepID=A0A8S9PI50_BRACR|nr:hypothetical protein F2Q69_00005379 [Brassica cretica]
MASITFLILAIILSSRTSGATSRGGLFEASAATDKHEQWMSRFHRVYSDESEKTNRCLSCSPIPQTGVPGIHHSTFESLRLGQSSQSIAVGLIRLWDFLNFKKDTELMEITVIFLDEKVNSVIHGLISAGRANHYMPSLKAGSIVKVVRFEVARCSSMYKIIDHPFLIYFIPPTIIDEVITSASEINLQS